MKPLSLIIEIFRVDREVEIKDPINLEDKTNHQEEVNKVGEVIRVRQKVQIVEETKEDLQNKIEDDLHLQDQETLLNPKEM
jgi:hypothetical protein